MLNEKSTRLNKLKVYFKEEFGLLWRLKNRKCEHKYKEIDCYLMFTGEDRVFYKCEMCGDEKDEYSLDTYNDVAKAQTYKEWYDNRLKLIMNG